MRRGAKNGAADAAAICEAVRRPHMRFVSVKSESNQGSRVCRLAGSDPASKLERGHNSISRHPQVGGCVPTSSACRRARSIVRYPKALAKVGGARIGALLQRRRPLIVAVASPHSHSGELVSPPSLLVADVPLGFRIPLGSRRLFGIVV